MSEKRTVRHLRRVEKKDRKLKRRIAVLESKGIKYLARPGTSLGILHKRMRRAARLRGIVNLNVDTEVSGG